MVLYFSTYVVNRYMPQQAGMEYLKKSCWICSSAESVK